MNAAEEVAKRFGVSVRTVYNAAKFADAIDLIAERFGPETKADILEGRIKTTQKMVLRVAEEIREGRI